MRGLLVAGALASTLGGLLVAGALAATPVEDPFEPNGSWNTAAALPNGVTVDAWIAPDGDVDWYTFTAASSGACEIRLESLPADYDLYVARRNPQTGALDGLPYQNHAGTTSEIFSTTVPSAGTYYVKVFAETGVFDPEDGYRLRAAWPGDQPAAVNGIRLGTARGASGQTAALAVDIDHESTLKAAQFDLVFDPEVAEFTSGAAAGRAAAMTFAAAEQSAGRVRLLLYFDDARTLAAGTGTVATLSFRLIGSAGATSAIAAAEVLLSDPAAQPVAATAAAGLLEVLAADQAPEPRLYVLRNPANPRMLQLLVAADQALASPPSVTAGGAAVTMTAVDLAENLYIGAVTPAAGGDSVTVVAVASNGTATGTIETVVVF